MRNRLNVVVIAAASFSAASVSLAQTSVFLPPAAVAAPATPSVQQPLPASTEAAAPADLDALDRDAHSALQSAHAAVDAYLHAAEDAVMRQLTNDADYRTARAATDAERRRLDDAKASGSPEAIHHAQEVYGQAMDHELRIRNAAFAASPMYQRARAMATEFAPPAPPAPPVAVAPSPVTDDLSRRIADAIADRRLCVGMTLADAVRAEGSEPTFVDSTGNVTRYRWQVTRQIGLVTEWRRDDLGRRYAVQVPRYGSTGEMNATFTDGRISDFTFTHY